MLYIRRLVQKFIKNDRGSALVYTTIVVFLSSLFFGAFLKIFNPLAFMDIKRETVEQENRLVEIQKHLSQFVETTGALPCPAPMDALEGDTGYGFSADCSASPGVSGVISTDTGTGGKIIRIGSIPTYTLNIKNSYMGDHVGKKIIYAVTEDLLTPATYSNDAGAIIINNDDGSERTGTALYALVTTGTESYDSCDVSRMDGENCDQDATFVDAELSLNYQSASYYDDNLLYSMNEPSTASAQCGYKGLLYAPGNEFADHNDCLNVTSYEEFQNIQMQNEPSVSCDQNGAFCDGQWIDLTTLQKGDYMIYWDAYLNFQYPQPDQYATVEFRVDDHTESSGIIPIDSPECNVVSQTQYEKGMIGLQVNEISSLQMRMRLYGGDYDPARPGCAAESTFAFVEMGDGALPNSRKSAGFRIMKREGGRDYTVASAFSGTPGGGGGGGGGGTPPEEDSGNNTPPDNVTETVEDVTVDGGTFSNTSANESPVIQAVAQDITGDVHVIRDGETVFLGDGFALLPGDKIITGDTSGVSLEFTDGSSFYLPGGTEFVINNYEYDTATNDGIADFSLLKGAFNLISGAMNKSSFKLDTPNATLGIRGTEVFGVYVPSNYRSNNGSWVYRGSYFILLDGEIQATKTSSPNMGSSSNTNTPYHYLYINDSDVSENGYASPFGTWVRLIKSIPTTQAQRNLMQSFKVACHKTLTNFGITTALETLSQANAGGCRFNSSGYPY